MTIDEKEQFLVTGGAAALCWSLRAHTETFHFETSFIFIIFSEEMHAEFALSTSDNAKTNQHYQPTELFSPYA